MRVMFFTYQLNYRGTTTAVADYAHYNQEYLGNTSIIAYDNKLIAHSHDQGTEPTVLESLSKRFEVVGLDQTDFNYTVDKYQIDNFYSLRAGWPDPLPTNCRTSVHVVFRYCMPHGNTYAYISEWLASGANQQFGQTLDFVPHIVNLPSPTKCLREDWGIPPDAKIIGRHGGADSFDIAWVKPTIARILEYRSDYWFVFLNTIKWIDHPRVLFLDPVHDLQHKANYIASCDAMIHARDRGESFGCSIAEFLYFNKPVIAWTGGSDRNHIEMLKDSPLLYDNAKDLELKLNSFYVANYDWQSRIKEFEPKPVMDKFNKVFLS